SGEETVAPGLGLEMRSSPLASVAPVTIHALPYFTRCTVVTVICRVEPASLWSRPMSTSTRVGDEVILMTWLTDDSWRKFVTQYVATERASPFQGALPSA